MIMKRNCCHLIVIFALIFSAAIFSGCTIIKGVADSISGNYINGLERTRQNSKTEIFDYRIDECFDKVLTILKTDIIKAKILKVDIYKYSILISVARPSMQEGIDSKFDGNNADVAIFFTELPEAKTKVEINSFSSPFRDYTAEEIFKELGK